MARRKSSLAVGLAANTARGRSAKAAAPRFRRTGPRFYLIGGQFDYPVFATFHRLRVTHPLTSETRQLIGEALNDGFVKHGLKPVFDDPPLGRSRPGPLSNRPGPTLRTISAQFDERVHKQFCKLKAIHPVTGETKRLMGEFLNDLFAKYGLPQVYQDPGADRGGQATYARIA